MWAKDGMLTEVEGVERGRLGLDGIGSLRGAHNWQNAATAYALARSQGLDASTIAKGLGTFAGLAHRMEQVARAGPVLFVNDSKATNADATAKALASFTDIYWIVGGRPKPAASRDEPFFPRMRAPISSAKPPMNSLRSSALKSTTCNAERSTAPSRPLPPMRGVRAEV